MEKKFQRSGQILSLFTLSILVLFLSQINAFSQSSLTESDKISEELTRMIQFGGAASQTLQPTQVVIEGIDAQHLTQIQQAIQASQGTIQLTQENQIQALIPTSSIGSLAKLPEVTYIRRPFTPVFDQGTIVGEGVKISGANLWQQAGLKGAGIKLAIVDAGFSGYKTELGTEIPAADHIVTRSFRADGDLECRSCDRVSQVHGLAVAEVAHDIAPDATLYLVNFETDIELEAAVDWLIEQGVNSINTSFGFYTTTCPYQGFGFMDPVFQKAQENGIFWAASSGNDGRQHWAGTYQDPDGNNFVNFSGKDESQTLTGLRQGDSITAILWWDDPCTNRTPNNYEVVIENSSGQTLDHSVRAGPRSGWPLEAIQFDVPSDGTYEVKIKKLSGDSANRLSLVFIDQEPEYIVPEGAAGLTEPEISQYVVGVGATDLQSGLEFFSSRGPTPDGRIKPDISAPDGVAVSRQTFGRFFGTSASSPEVAAAGALVKFAFPDYTPTQIANFLESKAEDLGSAGKDPLYGAGLLQLGPPPFSLIKPPAVPSDLKATVVSPTEVDLTWVDNSSDEDGFTIERRLQTETNPEAFVTQPDVTSYKDTEAQPATSYCYRVRSFSANGSSDPSDEVCVTTPKPNSPPVAKAGEDQSVVVGTSVKLNGSGSSDPDGDALTFKWAITTNPGGSQAALNDPSSATPSFTPDVAGLYGLTLTVTDPAGASANDQVQVTATAKQEPTTGTLIVVKFVKIEFLDVKQWGRSLQSGCVIYQNISDTSAGIRVTLTDNSVLEAQIPSWNQLLVCGDVVHIDTRVKQGSSSSNAKKKFFPPPGIPEAVITPGDEDS
jgi:hypothetical protein